MPESPFDSLIADLWTKAIQDGKPHDKTILALTFLRTCASRHGHLHAASVKYWVEMEEMGTRPSGTMTGMEALRESMRLAQMASDARVSYFGLVEELNRFGRIFERRYGRTLPLLPRIRFYRDKLVEHSDSYEAFLRSSGDSIYHTKGKLVIPQLLGTSPRFDEAPAFEEAFRAEVEKFGGVLGISNVAMPPSEYAEVVFRALEQIDPTLRLPEAKYKSLVNALFDYRFPTPIHDVEDYAEELIAFVEGFLKT